MFLTFQRVTILNSLTKTLIRTNSRELGASHIQNTLLGKECTGTCLCNITFWPTKIITIQNVSTGEKALNLLLSEYIQIEEPFFFPQNSVCLPSKHHIWFPDMTLYSFFYVSDTALMVCIVLKYPLHI